MKRVLALALSILLCSATMFNQAISVYADTSIENDENIRYSILLTNFYSYVTSSSNTLYITGYVTAVDTMAKIGFIDFEIQRSTTGTGNWIATSYNVSDQIKKDDAVHSLAQYPVDVAGGYYYRVCLNFYAKEYGWFFPSSETIPYETSAVWVPSS